MIRQISRQCTKMISIILTPFSYFPVFYPFTYYYFFCNYGLGTWLSLYVSLFYRYNQFNKDCFFKEWASKCSNTYKGHKVLQCANKDQSNSKVNFAAWTLDSNNLKKMFLKSKKHSMESGKIISWKAACILWILIYLYTKPLMNNDFVILKDWYARKFIS